MKLPTLIPEWRDAWRFASMRAAVVLAVLSLIQADVFPYLQPLVPPERWPLVSFAMAALIGLFRILSLLGPQEPQK